MKKISSFIILCVLCSPVFAWTIGPMNYQGRLLDNTGIPVTGSYNFKVRIYDALTNGTLKFSEDQNNIVVADGVYSFLVSTGTNSIGAWDINLWNTPSLYLEIVVNGQALTPRHLLAAAPFAFQANLALTTNNALALGGKSSGAVLQDICASTKGKWLDLAQKCLGVGSSFPGPTVVSWSTLSTDSCFCGLDLTDADISGINFSGAALVGSTLTRTRYSVQSLIGAGLSGSRWNAAVATDTNSVFLDDIELEDMHMQNMSLSKWNISNAQMMSSFQAADLTACPAAMGSGWQCKLNLGYYGGYYLLGPTADLSSGSIFANNPEHLLDSRIQYDNVNLTYANFGGDLITQTFLNSNLSGAGFEKAHIISPRFDNTMLDGVDMQLSKIERTIFTHSISTAYFQSATLEYVRFEGAMSNVNFNGATLVNVVFTQPITNVDFTDAILDRVTFAGGSGTVSTGVRLYGGTVLPP